MSDHADSLAYALAAMKPTSFASHEALKDFIAASIKEELASVQLLPLPPPEIDVSFDPREQMIHATIRMQQPRPIDFIVIDDILRGGYGSFCDDGLNHRWRLAGTRWEKHIRSGEVAEFAMQYERLALFRCATCGAREHIATIVEKKERA